MRTMVAGVVLLLVASGCGDGDDPEASAAPGSPSSSVSAQPDPSPDSPLPAPSTTGTVASYVALGDSYTAAPGVPVTDTSNGCLRSDGNYPALIAKALGVSYVDVSCGGASTTSLVGTQQTSTGPVPPQFDALEESTELVTLGIGGNDLSLFSDLVSTCVQASRPDAAGSPCHDALIAGGQDRLVRKIRVIEGRVTSAVRGIHDRAPEAEVVVVGYPQLAPAKGTCAELPLAAGDYPYVRAIAARLGVALANAAREGDATYIDLLGPSRGHDICAGDEAWVNGIDSDLERAIAFHPFAVEQQAVAQLVLDAL
jgi:hypothetical protein